MGWSVPNAPRTTVRNSRTRRVNAFAVRRSLKDVSDIPGFYHFTQSRNGPRIPLRVFPQSEHLYLVVTNVIVLLATVIVQQEVAENPAILQIHVIEGEGVAYPLGGRATRGVTVQVTDETGKPVEGASVSFRLPDEGPSGTFANGSRSEIATSKADGKAAAWGMLWNRTEGSFEIRITAVKGAARAGTVCPVYLSKTTMETSDTAAPLKLARSHKWMWITLAVAGAAGVGVAAAAMGGKASAPVGPAVTPTSIGTPSIVIGH